VLMSNTAHNLDYKHLEALKTKSQLNTIITNKDATPDYLAINIYYDSLRSWYSPKKQYQEAGNVIHIKKLKSDGIYYSAEQLSKKHGCSKETIRKKLVKLELLGLIHRNFEHKSTPTTNSYNHRCIFVWKNTPHFYNPYGVDRKQIKKLKSQTNAEYVKSKYGVEFGVKTREDALLESGGGIHTLEDTKELREPFNKLKDRSNTQVRESNFVNFNQLKDKIETAELGETKKLVSGGYSANTELKAEVVGQVASVIKLKSRNKNLTNRRKTRTNAELKKYKATKVIRDGFLGKGRYLREMQEYLTDELCQILRDKSGREFDNRAIKEITKAVAAKTQEKEAFFNHINGFTAYLAMILKYEKRQACQTNTEGFYTLAGISEETKQIQKRENFLDKIERYEGREPESCFKRRISGCLDPSKAYEFLTAMRYGNLENDILTIYLRKPVELTDNEKETILLQGALTYAEPNDRDPEGKSIKFVVSQAYNQIEQVLIEENIKIPEGVWGKIVSCFINYYGKDAYINWISKLLVTENDKLVELTTNSEMVKDRIIAEYWTFLEEVSEAYDGWVVLR
jgi:hypothetical protein